MNQELQRRHQEDLAFFGRIGADVSHEMRNILSVVGEYAGLLDDLVALAEKGKSLDCEKLKQVSARLTGQVRKGTEAMERFSRFAHAADEQTASFDLTALTGNIAALAQRQVTLAGSRLEAELPDQAIPVRSNSFRLQHAVFSAIQLILPSLEKGELVTIKVTTQGPMALISISASATAADRGDQLSGRISQLAPLMNELEGSIEASWADGTLSLIITIPIK